MAYQDRHAPTADFVNGNWRDLEAELANVVAGQTHQIALSYTPVP